ncbi:GNAT family N-acetyltransferase [Enterovibrio norvegicus]|uniref:GNAT family N-acetyltransferase n=1 Tax=Enterovibrio norvegicus TaxID=188144 RepID=A0A2N7L8W6_9GAMM|nr:GNAT family N-acetyltransferase [Enterovibrio norvegicus]PMN90786.1 GNAT family N-acetyltransferase [Enterovibrio norvegicus]
MLNIKKLDTLDTISELKTHYFSQATSPLDGMWHFGFVPMSAHFGFYENEDLVGFCCVNGEGYLLQFYLSPIAKISARDLFAHIAQQGSDEIGSVKGAFVSTAETSYLSLSLDNSASFVVNSLMYQRDLNVALPCAATAVETLDMVLATEDKCDEYVAFAVATIGAPEQWLSGYFGNLIQRQELWGHWKDGQLVATGECRRFDEHQMGYADLGMIVAESERGKGMATRVLCHLVKHAEHQGLSAMCSTESGNVGAQKAISRAGLSSSNRIVQFEFIASH